MVDDESITLLVPNRFHYEWLESKYRHLIGDAIESSFEKPFIVNYSVLLTEKTPDNIPKFKETLKKLKKDKNQQSKVCKWINKKNEN